MTNTQKQIHPMSYFEDLDLPPADYYKQFPTAKNLELGKVYRQAKSIYTRYWKIIFIGDGVALGVVVSDTNGNCNKGEKCLFTTSGLFEGWKYQDQRWNYRLVEEVADTF
ncbi:hypothetical protein VP496E541_P0132 [Vibrio phage 496E54-1]|nr:hypothetical protein VP495E541_P0131 [Vibrio phage 495E54-1]CAH9013852.1 hypothetical protein VP496E541_P0132 [Vibrio phage 496E54-1]